MPSATSTTCRTLDSDSVENKKPASAGFFVPTANEFTTSSVGARLARECVVSADINAEY
jgi:hypothetical protein